MNIEITGPLSTIVNISKYQFDLKKNNVRLFNL